MNTLHIISSTTWRGGERQVLFLMEGLKQKGHQCFLMSPENAIIRQRSKDLIEAELNFRKGIFSIIRNSITLKAFCHKNKVDIVHGHDSHAHTLLWMSYKFCGLKTKSVVTRRLMNPIKSRSTGKYNYPRIERIICISQAVFNALNPSISNKNRLEIIHSGIRLNSTSQIPKSTKNENVFSIGYVAAFTSEKDHTTFIKTAKYLITSYPEQAFKFVLIGVGPLKVEIERLSQSINANFLFTGFVEQVDQYYQELDVLFHPSKSEALGTAILDAMKYGLPVVASNVGGIPEIIEHGDNGFLLSPGDFQGMGDAIFRLASDPELYTKMADSNKERVINFGIESMVEKTINLYESIN